MVSCALTRKKRHHIPWEMDPLATSDVPFLSEFTPAERAEVTAKHGAAVAEFISMNGYERSPKMAVISTAALIAKGPPEGVMNQDFVAAGLGAMAQARMRAGADPELVRKEIATAAMILAELIFTHGDDAFATTSARRAYPLPAEAYMEVQAMPAPAFYVVPREEADLGVGFSGGR